MSRPQPIPGIDDASIYRSPRQPEELIGRSLDLTGVGDPLPVRVTAPRCGSDLPVIVFCHGMYGSRDGYRPLVRHWAERGHVVVRPTHGDSLDFLPAGVKLDPRHALSFRAARAADVSRVLDRLEEVVGAVAGLATRADCGRVGVGGHSLGAHTAQLVGGMRFGDETGGWESLADPRPRAFVMLSPHDFGVAGSATDWSPFTRPGLFVTGSEDSSPVLEHDAADRVRAYERSPVGDRYLLYARGAHHGLGGITDNRFRGSGPVDPPLLRIVQSTTLAFWDAFLHHDPDAESWLRSNPLAGSTGGAVRLERRAT